MEEGSYLPGAPVLKVLFEKVIFMLFMRQVYSYSLIEEYSPRRPNIGEAWFLIGLSPRSHHFVFYLLRLRLSWRYKNLQLTGVSKNINRPFIIMTVELTTLHVALSDLLKYSVFFSLFLPCLSVTKSFSK